MKIIRLLAVLAIIAFCLTSPFAIRSYLGDDFQFHFSSWIGLRQAWLAGSFAPGWDALANYKLGDPRFSFYPPISFGLGALLTTILPASLAPAAFVWFALVLSGLTAFCAAGSISGGNDREIVAVLYMLSPYILITAITRFAVAELLVLAWLPLILLYFLKATTDRSKRSALILACLLALTWLTNIPASIVLGYVLLFVAVVAAFYQRSLRTIPQFLAVESVAILAAAFSLVPAFFEMKWITTSALLHQDFREYFVFGPISQSHRLRFELGLWAVTCVEIILIAACIVSRGRSANRQYRLFYVAAAVAFFFDIPLSAIFWMHLPMLRFVQYPFRFLAIIGAVLSLIVAGTNRKLLTATCALTALMALLPIASYLSIRHDAASRLPNVAASTRDGFLGNDEYTPAGAATPQSPVAMAPVSILSGSQCNLFAFSDEPRRKTVSVNAANPCRLRFATFFYPDWQATDEAGNSLQTSRDNAGLLLVLAPTGQHTIQVRFRMDSPVRVIGDLISLAAIIFLVLAFRKSSSRNSMWHTGKEVSSSDPELEKVSASVSNLLIVNSLLHAIKDAR